MKALLDAVFLAPLAKRVNLDLLDLWDLLEKRAFLVYPERLENRVLQAFPDVGFPVHPEIVVILVFLVLMA